MRHLFGITLSVGMLYNTCFAQHLGNPIRSDLGVGARAIAMGGSYTAIASDVSGMFWNPAGLSFAGGPQASVSLGGLQPAVQTVYQSSGKEYESDSRNQRFHIGNIGLILPLSDCNPAPVLGFSFQNPYVTDVVLDFKGRTISDDTKKRFSNQFLSLGRISFWTVGGALPLSDQFTLGASASLITGEEINEIRSFVHQTTESEEYESEDHINYTRDYKGFDFRLGMMIRPSEDISIGARMEMPSTISFEETGEQSSKSNDEYYDEYTLHGTLQSYFKFSGGAAFVIDNLIFSTELHSRAPRTKRSLSDHCGRFKSGGSMGLEWTPNDGQFSLRGGYGWDQYDPTPYRVSYEQEVEEEPLPDSESSTGIHNLSVGAQWEIGDNGLISLAYGRRYYKLETEGTLEEVHSLQHGLLEFTFHF